VLSIMVSLAVSFLVASRIETLKALNFKEAMKASSIADAAIEHAKSLLREDKSINRYDDYTEGWHTAFIGSDVDNDGDGTAEAKWIDLIDESAIRYGRYAVTVIDEASKVNVNAAGYHNENALKVTPGWSPFEVSMSKLFSALECSKPVQMRDDIIAYRYGGNYPGASDALGDDNGNRVVLANDGLDNNADGDIDEAMEGVNEPLEFNPYDPYGDDVPFLTIYDLKKIESVKAEFTKIVNYVTAYSSDKEINKYGSVRLDLNQTDAVTISNILKDKGINFPEQIAANIIDYRDADNVQTTIVTSDGSFYGVEGIRFNELMIRPIYTFDAIEHTNVTGPGGNWILSDNYFVNALPEIAGIGGTWWFDNIRPGTYYLRLYGTGSGQTVGDVKVAGTTHVGMKHGDTFVETITIEEDGRLKIKIYNAEIDQPGFSTYFYRFELLEQPDCEYIELINITDDAIDVSDWWIEGLRDNDLIAIIPSETIIDSFDYLILTVDKNDEMIEAPANVLSNDISFMDTWAGSLVDETKVVQLLFSDEISRNDDVINDYPSANDNTIVLKDSQGYVVDRVRYTEAYTTDNRAAERADPASNACSDGSRIFNQWVYSDGLEDFLPKGTPSQQNVNINILGHTFGGINSSVRIKNNVYGSVGDLIYVNERGTWQRLHEQILEKFVDHFCVTSLRLEAEGHSVSGSEGGWQEMTRAAPYTNWFISSVVDDEGVWEFTRDDRLKNGIYNLTIYGSALEALSVAIKNKDGAWSDYSPPLIPNTSHAIHFGLVDVGGTSSNATPEETLEIRIKNNSELEKASFDYIVLAPMIETVGRINVNTASIPVLQSLPGVTPEVAESIYRSEYKPYGEDRGLGDILHGDTLHEEQEEKKRIFKQIANLITVSSDVYSVIVTAEAFNKNRKTAAKKARIIIER